jgi:hypothetical protein
MAASLILRTVKGTPLTNLEVDNNFSNISTYANTIDANIGLLASLTTTSTSNIVAAVNSVKSDQGNISLLTTTSTSNIVAAVNSIKSGNLSQFGSTTSAQLISIVPDETGSGNLVFSTSAVLTTPTIGAASGTSLNVSGNLTSKNFFSETAELTSYGSVRSLMESANVTATAPVANTNIDLSTRAIQYFTSNAANNFTLNLRANSTVALNSMMTTGNTITTAVMVTNGVTPYYPSAVQIDGTGQTIKWQNGSAVSAGNASAIDIYTFTILKTGSAVYTVLGTQTKFA